MCTIISCGLYILNPFFKANFVNLRDFILKILLLCIVTSCLPIFSDFATPLVSIEEWFIMAHVGDMKLLLYCHFHSIKFWHCKKSHPRSSQVLKQRMAELSCGPHTVLDVNHSFFSFFSTWWIPHKWWIFHALPIEVRYH